MIIKNILLINDDKIFINSILKTLCINNIQYTYIKENSELHFDKYIIRFFTKKNIIEFLDIDFKEEDLLFNIYEMLQFNNLNNYLNDDLNGILFLNDDNKKRFHDYMINNHMLNKQVKNNNIVTAKTLKKQLNPTRKIYK